MIHTGRVLIVEGKYDAARLAHLTDAMILLTDGFGIYKDKKRQQLFKALAQKNGLILLIYMLPMLLVVLAVLGGIGALVYFKFIKQKPKTKGSDNLDDYDYGEDDTEQEDEDPWETEESDEPEDAGGGGDEESENPAK